MEQTQATCERCGRAVEQGGVWTLTANIPPVGRVERTICVICAAELRRHLLRGPESRESEVHDEKADDLPSGEATATARAGWFLVRGLVYVAIALAAFVLITWLTSR